MIYRTFARSLVILRRIGLQWRILNNCFLVLLGGAWDGVLLYYRVLADLYIL